jgi:hypothetical protein
MHHHLEERRWNGRARCVGLQHQRINLHAYHLTPWFGRWQPPGRTGPVTA